MRFPQPVQCLFCAICFLRCWVRRATPVRVLESLIQHRSFDKADINETTDEAHTRRTVQEQLQLCATNGDILLVCGTAFIMAEVRAALGIVEPRVRLSMLAVRLKPTRHANLYIYCLQHFDISRTRQYLLKHQARL